MPATFLPSVSVDTKQILALVALFSAGLVLVEYMSNSPSLVEFRDAPPFNRIRFGAMFMSIVLLTIMFRSLETPSVTGQFFGAVGLFLGYILDFSFSPVHLFRLVVHPAASGLEVSYVRAAAAVAYTLSIMAICLFSMAMRLGDWPKNLGTFNVWVNLPTFDPTAGGDIVKRMHRQAIVNISVGILLPFVVPAVIISLIQLFGPILLTDAQTLIWMVSIWAILPAGLVMRGMAINRIAIMISQQRERQEIVDTNDGLQPSSA